MARTGQQIERYTVERVLGEGAMAKVFAVRHDTLETAHALKILTGGDKTIQDRLVREGQVQASLRHSNVVAVTDVFKHNGAPVLLMELVQGPDLDEYLERHTPNLDEALAIFGGILSGMRSAHNKGITHRDLKPGNVLLHIEDGVVTPKVADFGLAKAMNEGGMKKTQAGTTMGTPAYMAPEQIRDASTADSRADIFSLGCILYELVCGQRCFLGENIFAIFSKIATSDFIPARQLVPDLPQEVIDTIEGALKIDRDERFSNCDEVAVSLFGKKHGFTTIIDSDSVGGAAAVALWAEQEAEVEPLGESDTFAMSLSEVTSEREALEEALTPAIPVALEEPVGGKSMMGFYVGLVGLTGALLVGIVLIAGVAIWGLTGEKDTPPVKPVEIVKTVEPPKPPPKDPVEPKDPVAPKNTTGPKVTPPKASTAPKPKESTTRPKTTVNPVKVKPPPKKTVPPAVVKPVEPTPAAGSTFSVKGDATNVRLVGGGNRYKPGQTVPVGRYDIEADFGGGPSPAGKAFIRADEDLLLKCISMMARCSAK